MVTARLDPDDRTAALSRAGQVDAREVQADIREAYERGRKDERASRRRHPVFMTLTIAAAIVGVVLLALAAINGSFASGGSVADQNLNAAVSKAEPQVRGAASQAGRSLSDAEAAVKAKTNGTAG